MTNITRIAGALAVLTIMWVALSERFTGPNIVLGLFAAIISLVLIRSIHDGQHRSRWSLKGLGLWLVYVAWLLGQIYLSGIHTIVHIFRGRSQPVLVSVETNLTDDFLIAVLAASITLTPGTITVARDGQVLQVLWLGKIISNQDEISFRILGRLEKLLLNQELAASEYMRRSRKVRRRRY